MINEKAKSIFENSSGKEGSLTAFESVLVKNVNVKALWDTGASLNLIKQDFLSRKGISPRRKTDEDVLMKDVYGERKKGEVTHD